MAEDRRWVGSDRGDGGKDGGDGVHVSAKQVFSGIVLLVLVIFVLQNTQSANLTLLVFDVSYPLWLVLAVTIALSLGIGYLMGSRRRKG